MGDKVGAQLASIGPRNEYRGEAGDGDGYGSGDG
jgi:hypothetical protein